MAEWKRNVADDQKSLMRLLILFAREQSWLPTGNCRSCDTGSRAWLGESVVVQAEGKRTVCDIYLFFKANLVPIVSYCLCRDICV